MKHLKIFEDYNNDSLINLTLADLTCNYTCIDVDKIINIIETNHINYGEYYIKTYIKDKKSQRRPIDLDNKIHIDGLVGNWTYPMNGDYLTNEFLLLFLMQGIKKSIPSSLMDELYTFYLKLNPEISNIPVNDYMDKFDVMMGMTSAFNYNDIYDYGVIGDNKHRSEEYKKKKQAAATCYAVDHLGYVPSEKTLDLIISSFDRMMNEDKIMINESLTDRITLSLSKKHLRYPVDYYNYTIKLSGKIIGHCEFYIDHSKKEVELISIVINDNLYKNKGFGARVLNSLKRRVFNKHTYSLVADCLSKQSLKMFIKVFGTPDMMADNINMFETTGEALAKLPDIARLDDQGNFLDGAESGVYIRYDRI